MGLDVLCHLLPGCICLCRRESIGEGTKERIGEQALRHLGISVAVHHCVPRCGHVQHGGGEPRLGGNRPRVVCERFDAERVGETPGRVDGDHTGSQSITGRGDRKRR